MITADTDPLVKSLEKAQAEIERKLLGMVSEFALKFTDVAVQATPIGDSVEYARLYQQRLDPLPKEEGMSRANWNLMDVNDFYPIYSVNQSLPYSDAKSYMNSYYKLGETFYLGNATPYIGLLENNASPQTAGNGISQPILDQILNVYQYRLDDYYKQS